MNIFEEILWPQFVKIEHVSKLPLNEQVAAYQQYLYNLSSARQDWLAYQGKGGLVPGEIVIGILAQEDNFDILQEDNSQIFVTTYA
jgi:hypothetical protein